MPPAAGPCGQPRGEPLTGHRSKVRAVALGEVDGQPVVVSGSSDGTVRLWDARSGRPRGEPLTGHTSEVHAVALGEVDGEPVVVSGGEDNTVWQDNTVWLWDARSHSLLRILLLRSEMKLVFEPVFNLSIPRRGSMRLRPEIFDRIGPAEFQ